VSSVQPSSAQAGRTPNWLSHGSRHRTAVTGAYLAGLRAGGWRGRDIRVRHAIAVTGAAKFCWLAR
jgi:hypothetical protein